jgi:hypothetical protein
MEKKDLVIALFGAAVGLAGILLVFVGFIYAHAETMELGDDRKKYKRVAKFGMGPFFFSLCSAFVCIQWLLCPSEALAKWSLYTFYLGMGSTALYGLTAFLFYL